MSAETVKLRRAIESQTDVEALRRIALSLTSALAALDGRRRADGYIVLDGAVQLASGTRDYCIGWAEAREGLMLYGGGVASGLRVMLGEVEVWPEYGFAPEST